MKETKAREGRTGTGIDGELLMVRCDVNQTTVKKIHRFDDYDASAAAIEASAA